MSLIYDEEGAAPMMVPIGDSRSLTISGGSEVRWKFDIDGSCLVLVITLRLRVLMYVLMWLVNGIMK